jgi:hypothetical protein
MSWERQKSTISTKPEEPSFILWMMLGSRWSVVYCCFVLHANKLAGPLQTFNLWAVTAGPAVLWFSFCVCVAGSITMLLTDTNLKPMRQSMRNNSGWSGLDAISQYCYSGIMLPLI